MSLVLLDVGDTTVGGQPLSFGVGGLLLGGQPVFSDEVISGFYGFGQEPTFSLFDTPGTLQDFLAFPSGPSFTGIGGDLDRDFSVGDFGVTGAGQVQDDVLLASIRQGLANPAFREAANQVNIDTATGRLTNRDGTPADPGVLASLEDRIGLPRGSIGRGLGVLGLGGIGLALGQLAAGGGERLRLPEPAPPAPAQLASRDALNRALTTTGAVPSVATGLPGTLPGGVPGAAVAPGVLAAALGPGATGQQDLETAFRLGLAGQRNIADLALGGTARELAATTEQAPFERAVRLGALGEVPGLLAPTGNLAPTLATGQQLSRSIANLLGPIQMRQDASGTWVPDLGSPSLPSVLRDPVRAALEQETLRVLSGQTPTPELERAEREETAQLQNQLYRMLGPGFELSTTGADMLRKLQESQQIRRNQYRAQTVASLAPQEAQRRQFGETATLNQLQTFLPAEVQRTGLAEDVRARGLGERLGVATLGRESTPQLSTTLQSIAPTAPLLGLGDAEAERRFQEQLRANTALQSFGLSQQERAARASGISSLFGTAAGTAFAPPSFSLRVA